MTALDPIKAMLAEGWTPRRDQGLALVAEIERLRNRIADAAAEANSGMYGDPENPFRVRAHLEPEKIGKTFGVDLSTLRVPLRIEEPSDLSSTGGEL